MGNYAVTRAKRFALTRTVRGGDGSVENITGATFRFVAKKARGDADADAILNLSTSGGTITLPTPAAGVVRVAPLDGWGATLPAALVTLHYELQMTRSGGDGPYVVDSGYLQVRPEVGTADPA